jgi:tRNA threonylcarbamoyladenosine biosynthesis protein TsaE
MTEHVYECDSPEATSDLAAALGRALMAGSVIALDGELGSGKTCFVRGLARGLEVTDPVSSPTYTLQHAYRGRLDLYHFDAWMQGRERAFLLDGGAEWFDAGGVCVIEWAERVRELLPTPRIEVLMEHREPTVRRVRFAVVAATGAAGEALEALLVGLAEAWETRISTGREGAAGVEGAG